MLTAAAYTVYYYVVYMGAFAVVYAVAWETRFGVTWRERTRTSIVSRVRFGFAVVGTLAAAVSLFIAVTGGGVITIGRTVITATTPQNTLSLMWVCAIA